jgi:hypothetical protein
MLHTQAGYISADCFHHFRIPACSPAADHTYPGDVRFDRNTFPILVCVLRSSR